MIPPVITFPDDPYPALPIGHLRALLAAARRFDTPRARRYAEHAEQILAGLDPRGRPTPAIAKSAESRSNGDVQKLAEPVRNPRTRRSRPTPASDGHHLEDSPW